MEASAGIEYLRTTGRVDLEGNATKIPVYGELLIRPILGEYIWAISLEKPSIRISIARLWKEYISFKSIYYD